MDDLFQNFYNNFNCEEQADLQGFADDGLLYISFNLNSMNSVFSLANRLLDSIFSWGENNFFKFSEHKMQTIIFSNKNRSLIFPPSHSEQHED